ncbi:MAG: molecular chaperone HtpG [Legionellales bacterium]|jgi:molecular chaperone HtpG|nr:molecular chaperone HtpG [Legionellales bacterium]
MTVVNKKVKKQTMQFQTEVEQLLSLLAKSVYSNKDIVLRELVSNASDAIDKLRYESKQNSELLADSEGFKIWIDFDQKEKTLSIRDNGIGMSKEELVANLGTIARSGTANYLKSLKDSGDNIDSLIGQFGVGFYSTFVIADKVTVTTKRASAQGESPCEWESSGKGDYVISPASDDTPVGTTVKLHLKSDMDNFLQDWYVRRIITTYSDHIDVPIAMKVAKEQTDEQRKENAAIEFEFEVVNQSKALWTQAKKDIDDEQYENFFNSLSHTTGKPLAWVHNKVEGKVDYTMLLYIPETAPFDLWNREKVKGIRLYSQRTFIMDDAEQFLPLYLRFVKGIVDSSDLPLNISREILQDSDVVNKIKSGCTKKILGLLEGMAKDNPEQYNKFWAQFGEVLKEGPGEDFANKDQIAKLLRFSTSKTESNLQTTSLADYVANMAKDQEKIYYVTAESYTAALHSPHLEVFKKHDIEVLLLSNRVDEWLASHLTEFADKKLVCVTKGELDLPQDVKEKLKQEDEETAKDYDDIIKRVKAVLGDKVKDVRMTSRLTDSPACLVADEQEMSANLKRMLRQSGQDFMDSNPILELNPSHGLVKSLKSEAEDDMFAKWCTILFNQAMLAEGGQLEDPATFVNDLNSMMLRFIGS